MVYSPAEVFLQSILAEKAFESQARGEEGFFAGEVGCVRGLITTMRSSAAGFLPGP